MIKNKFTFYNLGMERFKVDHLTFYFHLAGYRFIWRALQAATAYSILPADTGWALISWPKKDVR